MSPIECARLHPLATVPLPMSRFGVYGDDLQIPTYRNIRKTRVWGARRSPATEHCRQARSGLQCQAKVPQRFGSDKLTIFWANVKCSRNSKDRGREDPGDSITISLQQRVLASDSPDCPLPLGRVHFNEILHLSTCFFTRSFLIFARSHLLCTVVIIFKNTKKIRFFRDLN